MMGTTFTNLANAIVQHEQSTWLNNPGAIEDANGNHIDFGSPEAGYDALLGKLQFDASGQSKVYNPGMSLQDFESTYTGGDSNAGSDVANILGVPASTPLSNLSDQAIGQPAKPFSLTDPSSWFVDQDPTGVNDPVKKAVSAITGIGSYDSDTVIRGVAILAGLVLLAGAVFGFKNIGTTVVNVSKTAAVAA
jgi:hypothetical protein